MKAKVQTLNLPLNQKEKLEKALIKNVKDSRLIYPGVYKRRFDINLKQFATIMEELIKYKYVKLRFQIIVDGVDNSELYKLSTIPETIYDSEMDIDIYIDFKKHLNLVYEVGNYES